MNRFCVAIAGCLLPAIVLAGGIQFFEGSFEEALIQAEEEGKHVFVDVYTTWCGPCKIMDAVVFPRDEVGEYYNARFVNVKLDAEDEAINGPAISERYAVGAYPTYLYLNPDGTQVGRALGALPPSLFVQVAGQLTEGVDSGFSELEARYAQGERDPAFVQDYLWAAQVDLALFEGDMMERFTRKDALDKAADEYFSARDYSELLNSRDYALIAHYKEKKPRGGSLVEYVIDNYEDFLEVAPEISLARLVLEINYYAMLDAAQQGDEQYLSYLDDLNGSLKPAADYIGGLEPDSELLHDSLSDRSRGEYLSAAGLWDELQIYVREILGRPDVDRFGSLRSAARYLQQSPKQEHQDLALEYAREAHQLEPGDWGGSLSYASLLAARGDAQEAENVLQATLDSLEGKQGVTRFREILQGQMDRIRQ